MMTTRRELFQLGLGSSSLLACGTTVPAFLARSALALDDGPKREAGGPILVVIQLDGGNDGLNTVVPHGDDIYHKNRPKLALKAKDLKPVDDHIGLHPSLEPFAKLREEGQLAIIQSVGYPNPNRSHFESMAIWQTGRLHTGQQEPGWLARALDSGSEAPGGDAPGMHIAADALPQALRGGKHFVPSLATADQLHRRLGMPASDGASDQRAALDQIAGDSAINNNPLLQFVARSTVTTYASSARLEAVLHDDNTPEAPDSYPLTRRLRLIASMIKAGLSTSIYYTQLGGFDTHADQLNQHAGRLAELSRSVRTFLGDLDRSGDGQRVTVLIFSEFGRRLHENASAGTDHGTAAPVFLIGRRVRGGLYGPYPDLAHLKDDDPEHAIDFRRVYATVLDQWLKLSSDITLGGTFDSLPLIRT
jgi:uncharacterized protein (DUF1501 family)